VILHGYWRSTGDLDIWVKRTEENYLKLTRAYYEFGLPLLDMTKANFLSPADFNVFTYGIPPVAIDVLTEVKGLEFASAFENSVAYDIDGLKVNVLSLKHLIEAKKASNRPRDLETKMTSKTY